MDFPGKFWSATKEYNTYEKHVAAPYIRKAFTAPACEKAELLVSGLGFYDIYLNGERFTKGLLAPYISNPDDIVYYDLYDVTSLIKEGENCVGLLLGNGMLNAPGGRVWDFDTAVFRGAPRFTMSICYTFADGTTATVEADGSFRCHASPLTFDDLRSGNFYDARLEIKDWCSPDFDDTAWDFVFPAETPRGEKRICTADPILPDKELSPVSVTPAKIDKIYNNRENMRLDTEFRFDFKDEKGALYDFGVNTAGIVRLKIRGEKGQRIFVQFCEYVDPEGEPSYRNIDFYPDGYAQSLHFICSGGEDTFESRFCYYGARYALVYGLKEEQKTADLLTFVVCHSAIGKRAFFTCSDEEFNRLIRMSEISDLANFFYFPTDCPHREKNGWTGDAAVSAEHMMLYYRPEKSYAEWLCNICKAQGDKGNLPGIVPTSGWGMEWGNGPAWDNVLTELCWQIWRLRGDLTPAKECSENMLRYLSYISQRRDENGLIAIGLGDWVQPGTGAGSPKAPLILTDSVMSMFIADKSAELFDALGLSSHAAFARTLASDFKAAIRGHLIDFNTMTVHSRCQTAQAICLYFGVFENAEKKAAGDVLVRLVHERDDHLDCGMIGVRVLFRVLADLGYADLAFKLITRPDAPSYGAFLRYGLTALPESFLSEEEIKKPDSLDHHFLGDYSAWALEYVAGIRPVTAKKADIRPCFIEKLTSAAGEYETPCGTVAVKWARNGEMIKMSVCVPEGLDCRIILPAGYVFYEPERWADRLHDSAYTTAENREYLIRRVNAC